MWSNCVLWIFLIPDRFNLEPFLLLTVSSLMNCEMAILVLISCLSLLNNLLTLSMNSPKGLLCGIFHDLARWRQVEYDFQGCGGASTHYTIYAGTRPSLESAKRFTVLKAVLSVRATVCYYLTSKVYIHHKSRAGTLTIFRLCALLPNIFIFAILFNNNRVDLELSIIWRKIWRFEGILKPSKVIFRFAIIQKLSQLITK